jgi:hypothetical protein
MARMKPQDLALLARRETVARLYLQRATQLAIGRALGVDQGTVSRDLKVVQRAWQQQAVEALEARKAEELARLDALERTYWRAWHRSRKAAERRQAKTVQGERARTEASKTEEGRDGDPRFLQGVERCIEQRCRLLGLTEPPPGGNVGVAVTVVGGIDLAVVTGQKVLPLSAPFGPRPA